MESGRISKSGSHHQSKQYSLMLLAIACSLLFLIQREASPPVTTIDDHLISMLRIDEGFLMGTRHMSPLGCDYTKGKWVRNEDEVPVYSGNECKAWLSEMWACRRFNRTDFNYEKYRWQPDHCDLPVFNGGLFLRRMENKVIAFVGDSLGRQQFQSLMCMATGGKEKTQVVEDASARFGLTKRAGATRPRGWAYRFAQTNTTILFYWSPTLAHIQPYYNNNTRPRSSALHLDLPCLFLRQNLHLFHVLVLNTGHHWNEHKFRSNKWRMHAFGKPLRPSDSLRNLQSAREFSLSSIVRWLNEKANSDNDARIYLQTLSPRHFFGGDWDSGGSCDAANEPADLRRMKAPLLDAVSEKAVIRAQKIQLLNITLLSQYRVEAHISKYGRKGPAGSQDCLHWCLPGVPDTWNHILFALLLADRPLTLSLHLS